MKKKNDSSKKDVFAEVAESNAIDVGLPPIQDVVKKTLPVAEMEIDDKLACGFTMREISQMKKAGMKKPDRVSWSEWNGPTKFTHRHMLICHLKALGYRNIDIAQATNISDQRVSDLLQQQAFQNQVRIIREVELQGVGTAQKIKQLAPQASRVYEEILHNPQAKMSLRQKTAQDVLDRELGKPLQRVENSGSLIKDFYQMLKAQQKTEAPVIDVTSETVSQERNESIENAIEVPHKKEEPKLIDADAWFKDNKI